MLPQILRIAAVGFLVAGLTSFTNAAGPVGVVAAASAHWPQWRGAGRDDLATDKGLLRVWPEGGPTLLWTGTGLGDGYASVVIDQGRIYTLGDREDGEYVICLDDGTGKEVWSKQVGERWKD